MSFNVLLNGYPVASADTFEGAKHRVGDSVFGRWSIEDGYGRELAATKDNRPKKGAADESRLD